MSEDPGDDGRSARTGLEGGIASAAFANSTAFGYSIMITVTFAVANRAQEQGDILDYFAFALGAALGVAVVNAAVTRGFRRRLDEAPPEVVMMGAAINFVSVILAILAGLGTVEALPELPGWFLAPFVSSGFYIVAEGFEIWVAEAVQAARGDREAERRR
jgi:hypothetical protein